MHTANVLGVANQDDVSRLALALPEAEQSDDGFGFSVRGKQLLASDPDKFFTEPHCNGFPAVMVRLSAVDVAELRELLTDAWRCQAPRSLVRDL
jgi:hypothetical protein